MGLGIQVTSLMNAVLRGAAIELEPYNISPLEFTALRICLARGEATMTELAGILPVDTSRTSRTVTGLVDKGLLRRHRRRDDRRVVMLRLSDQGVELTSTLQELLQAFDAKLTENINADELSLFASVVERIAANHAAMQSSE